jgi:hypothetical protein
VHHAARFDVRPGVVRYWVRKGWIEPVEGRGMGHTQWFDLDEAAVRRLEAAKASRRSAVERTRPVLERRREVSARSTEQPPRPDRS